MALAKKKRVLVGFGIVLAVLLLAGVGYVFFIHKQDTQIDTAEKDAETVKVAGAVARGNYKDIQVLYDQKMSQMNNQDDKAKLSYEAASLIIASVAGEEVSREAYETALTYALGADTVQKTPQSAAQVGRVYYELGNQDKADEYFKLAIERGEK